MASRVRSELGVGTYNGVSIEDSLIVQANCGTKTSGSSFVVC